MQVTQDVKKEILKFSEKKIDTDEMWAEAFSKLICLDEVDQNGVIWDMLEDINSTMRWDKLFEEHPEVLDRIVEEGRRSAKEEGTISLEEFLALTEEDDLEPASGQ